MAEQERQYPHELYDFLEAHPVAKDALASWLRAGGDEILKKAQDMARGDMYPYTAPQHVQASFGAFVGGVAWLARTLLNAVEKSNNANERRKMAIQATGGVEAAQNELLREMIPDYDAIMAKLNK